MDILVGVLMVAMGLALAFAGLRVFMIALPILGFLAGISLGLAIMYWAFDEGILSTAAGIVVGFFIGIVFALLSYMFWYVAVLLGAAALGASIGAWLMDAFNVNTDWLIVVVAIIGGILLVALTLILDLPVYWVIVVTAFNGAAWVVAGLLMIFDRIDRDHLTYGTIAAAYNESWVWTIVWIVVAALGLGSQLTKLAEALLPQDKWTQVPAQQLKY